MKACPVCNHFACVCDVRRRHYPQCPYRLAAAGDVPIECEHGRDCCPECDACTCEALEDLAMEEVEP